MSIMIRSEQKADWKAIWHVTQMAFEGRPYAGGDEQDLIDNLRANGALSVSLVAIDDSVLVGQVTFSPASISSGLGKWFALGPISVLPERQGEGIGGSLIAAGMNVIEQMGASGCILTGDPRYYVRHGFALAPEHCPDNEPREHFMLRLLGTERPLGTFAFHSTFYAGNSTGNSGRR